MQEAKHKMPAILSKMEAQQAQALVALSLSNPFTAERVAGEKRALGPAYIEAFAIWVVDPERQGSNPNIPAMTRLCEALCQKLGAGLCAGKASAAERELFEGLALYQLYYRVEREFFLLISEGGRERQHMPFYPRFAYEVRHLLAGTGLETQAHTQPAHLFALFFQLRRAFHFIFRAILGTSSAASRLRAEVWQAMFTHDMRRFQHSLYARMHDMPTLILGPSGTGKELVASAIGRSRYIPFNEKTLCFEVDYEKCFRPVHLAALPTTTLESELFGHRKGAFTGAVNERQGMLETTHAADTVFLDEIGELPAEVQVKLLRVLQTRQFQRLGDNDSREFKGRILAATHRDLGAEIRSGRFREDLFYRLCADTIRTPSLREQLSDDPAELHRLVEQVALRLVGPELAAAITEDASRWIGQELADHPWPGNMRELEQCLRSIIIRGRYTPLRSNPPLVPPGVQAAFSHDVLAARLSHEALLGRYYALAYWRHGSFDAAARALNTDRRTIKNRLDHAFLAQLQNGEATTP